MLTVATNHCLYFLFQKVELLRKNVHETEEEIIALRALLLDMEKAQEVEAEPDHSHEASQGQRSFVA